MLLLCNPAAWCCALAAVLLSAASVQAADVYVAYDENGVAQFAPRALDERYRLLFKDLRASAGGGVLAQPGADVERALQHAATRHGVDYALLYAVARAESGFNTKAVSPKGAVGIMQIMPGTARRYGVQGDDALTLKSNLEQLHINVDAGSRYLRDLLGMFNGDTELAVAAYNAGEGAVQRNGNRIPPYEETQTYVTRVMQTYRELQPAAAAPSRPLAQVQQVPPRRQASAGTVQVFIGATQEIKRFERGFGAVR